MTQKTRPIFRSATILFLALLLITTLLPVKAGATDFISEETIELTGTSVGRFELNSSTSELFALEGFAPGDTWSGKLNIVNATNNTMQVSLISIVSNIEDLLLYDTLELKISNGEDVLYEGSYGATSEPVTDLMDVPRDKPLQLDLFVEFPRTAGNELQGKEMDSTWTFEAYYDAPSDDGPSTTYLYKVEYVDGDGNHLLPSKFANCERGELITEYAPEIEGYTPDAEVKTLKHKPGAALHQNTITFIYSPVGEAPVDPDSPDQPTDPTQPADPDEPTDPTQPGKNPQTGHDLTESNTTSSIWYFVIGLCLCGAGIILIRLDNAIKRAKAQNSQNKEASTRGKD